MTIHLIKLVKLSVWPSGNTFRTHMYTPLLNIVSTPQQSPRLAIKRTCLEAEMESPTIRKVRACFGEGEKYLFSPTQECLTSLLSVIEVIAVKASYYFVNGFTRNIFTVMSQNIAQFFSMFYRELSQCSI